MKKLLFILSTITVFTVLSCEKENTVNAVNAVTAKWTMGASGIMDTTITLKPQATGDMLFKISKNSLCPTHAVGVIVKVNGTMVLEKSLSLQDTIPHKIPVKVNDIVTVRTNLVETFSRIACIWLGVVDCEITE